MIVKRPRNPIPPDAPLVLGHLDRNTPVLKIEGGPVGATFWVTENGTPIVTESSQLIWTPI